MKNIFTEIVDNVLCKFFSEYRRKRMVKQVRMVLFDLTSPLNSTIESPTDLQTINIRPVVENNYESKIVELLSNIEEMIHEGNLEEDNEFKEHLIEEIEDLKILTQGLKERHAHVDVVSFYGTDPKKVDKIKLELDLRKDQVIWIYNSSGSEYHVEPISSQVQDSETAIVFALNEVLGFDSKDFADNRLIKSLALGKIEIVDESRVEDLQKTIPNYNDFTLGGQVKRQDSK